MSVKQIQGKPSWSAVLAIFWEKLKSFSSILTLTYLLVPPPLALSKEVFKFALGDQIQIFSDKAYRHSKNNVFEAVGNIIITYNDATIYGDQARIDFSSGDIHVQGNIRYIESDMTIYGPEFKYNFKTKNFSLAKSRLTTSSYIISGDKIDKTGQDTLIAENAEYTTCQDCPESWSVYGRRIHITADRYARIWHAYIKVKGVVTLYIPYIILPIKTKRETGFLFPKLSLKFDQGLQYQQPWFWNISDHADMTLTPSLWGNRGWGHQFQLRQMFGEKKWYEINSFQIEDRIYLPEKKELTQSGNKFFRHISDYEHHYTAGNWFNHHFNYTVSKDLDSVRDFNFYTDHRIEGSEIGGGGFFEFKNSLGQATAEGYFNRNTLFPDALGFDHRYVQILPRIKFSMVPIRILKTSFPIHQKIFLGMQGDITRFKQNHTEEQGLIRNAIRYNSRPYINWKFIPLSPVKIETTISFEHQYYRFPHLDHQESFAKQGIIYETQGQMTFEKTFGSARLKKAIQPHPEPQANPSLDGIIGDLPPLKQADEKKKHLVIQNSFKHTQNIRVKHYFLGDQQWRGNTRWRQQIENSSGQFDLTDALRRKEHTINTLTAKTSLPLSNTLEFQWNNTLVRKTPSANNTYTYRKVAWLDTSQGYDLYSRNSKFRKNLTRLHVTGGIHFNRGSLSLSDYYFYDSRKHIASLRGRANYSRFSMGLELSYDAFTSPRNKRINISGGLKLSDFLRLDGRYKYDIEHKRALSQGYKVLYTPDNNCWRIELDWDKTVLEQRISLNFLINFNNNSFRSLN